MKFSIFEQDEQQDIQTIEKNSTILVEFHIYTLDQTNPQADQFIAQLEQRISAFGAKNTEEQDEVGHAYSMFRLTGKTFNNPQEVSNFFQNEFKDFIQLMNQIWRNRIPNRNYTLLYQSDYNEMIRELSK